MRWRSASISAEQAQPDHRQTHVDDASSYLRLACEIASKDLPPFLAITAGVTGTGKSTVAELIAAGWNAVHLRTDAIRRELAGLSPTERSGSEMFSGLPGVGAAPRRRPGSRQAGRNVASFLDRPASRATGRPSSVVKT